MIDPEPSDTTAADSLSDLPDVEITEFGGIQVAYLPGVDDAWISGWVDVPL